jgi:D-2-hydroxyacid dehydrogenase (NADP+)
MPNVVLTPHTAGETCAYERNVLDFLDQNLKRLWEGQQQLVNQVI